MTEETTKHDAFAAALEELKKLPSASAATVKTWLKGMTTTR